MPHNTTLNAITHTPHRLNAIYNYELQTICTFLTPATVRHGWPGAFALPPLPSLPLPILFNRETEALYTKTTEAAEFFATGAKHLPLRKLKRYVPNVRACIPTRVRKYAWGIVRRIAVREGRYDAATAY